MNAFLTVSVVFSFLNSSTEWERSCSTDLTSEKKSKLDNICFPSWGSKQTIAVSNFRITFLCEELGDLMRLSTIEEWVLKKNFDALIPWSDRSFWLLIISISTSSKALQMNEQWERFDLSILSIAPTSSNGFPCFCRYCPVIALFCSETWMKWRSSEIVFFRFSFRS